jgi:flavin-dependent dehydrogenase
MKDVLIIGGGPAGLAAALHARRAGLDVTVLDPRGAPIDKACGEGLMPGGVAALHRLGVRPPGMPFRGIRYLDGRDRADRRACATADFPDGSGLGLRRLALHGALHQAVVDAGAELGAARVHDVQQDGEYVQAAGVRARYLIAADGLHSPVRRALGLERAARGRRRWGIRAHHAIAPWSEYVEVYWGEHGEAYVTPVAPDCVGVAFLGSGREPFAERLAAFPALRERLAGAVAGPVLAAGPLHQRVSRPVAGRVLLIGDAAGYVDALTGEGLSLGFRCAEAAVEAIARDAPEQYVAEHRRITRRYRLLTVALVRATVPAPSRRAIVPLATRAPWLFRAAVAQLAR